MRRHLITLGLILAFALSACMPGIPLVSPNQSQATTIALAGTQAAYTLAALPTLTLPPSNTPLPTFTLTTAPTATKAPTKAATATLATSTASGTQAATGTQLTSASLTQAGGSATSTLTVTGTAATPAGTATITRTPTPGVLLWGTVPPEVPWGRVHLINGTSDMVYISFHCTLENGLTSYLEFPVYSRLTVSIPAALCHYVAWVKGKEFTGDIRIKKLLEYTFTFKNQKILISQP